MRITTKTSSMLVLVLIGPLLADALSASGKVKNMYDQLSLSASGEQLSELDQQGRQLPQKNKQRESALDLSSFRQAGSDGQSVNFGYKLSANSYAVFQLPNVNGNSGAVGPSIDPNIFHSKPGSEAGRNDGQYQHQQYTPHAQSGQYNPHPPKRHTLPPAHYSTADFTSSEGSFELPPSGGPNREVSAFNRPHVRKVLRRKPHSFNSLGGDSGEKNRVPFVHHHQNLTPQPHQSQNSGEEFNSEPLSHFQNNYRHPHDDGGDSGESNNGFSTGPAVESGFPTGPGTGTGTRGRGPIKRPPTFPHQFSSNSGEQTGNGVSSFEVHQPTNFYDPRKKQPEQSSDHGSSFQSHNPDQGSNSFKFNNPDQGSTTFQFNHPDQGSSSFKFNNPDQGSSSFQSNNPGKGNSYQTRTPIQGNSNSYESHMSNQGNSYQPHNSARSPRPMGGFTPTFKPSVAFPPRQHGINDDPGSGPIIHDASFGHNNNNNNNHGSRGRNHGFNQGPIEPTPSPHGYRARRPTHGPSGGIPQNQGFSTTYGGSSSGEGESSSEYGTQPASIGFGAPPPSRGQPGQNPFQGHVTTSFEDFKDVLGLKREAGAAFPDQEITNNNQNFKPQAFSKFYVGSTYAPGNENDSPSKPFTAFSSPAEEPTNSGEQFRGAGGAPSPSGFTSFSQMGTNPEQSFRSFRKQPDNGQRQPLQFQGPPPGFSSFEEQDGSSEGSNTYFGKHGGNSGDDNSNNGNFQFSQQGGNSGEDGSLYGGSPFSKQRGHNSVGQSSQFQGPNFSGFGSQGGNSGEESSFPSANGFPSSFNSQQGRDNNGEQFPSSAQAGFSFDGQQGSGENGPQFRGPPPGFSTFSKQGDLTSSEEQYNQDSGEEQQHYRMRRPTKRIRRQPHFKANNRPKKEIKMSDFEDDDEDSDEHDVSSYETLTAPIPPQATTQKTPYVRSLPMPIRMPHTLRTKSGRKYKLMNKRPGMGGFHKQATDSKRRRVKTSIIKAKRPIGGGYKVISQHKAFSNPPDFHDLKGIGPSQGDIEYGGFRPIMGPKKGLKSRKLMKRQSRAMPFLEDLASESDEFSSEESEETSGPMGMKDLTNEIMKLDFKLLKPYKSKSEKATVVTALRKRMLASMGKELALDDKVATSRAGSTCPGPTTFLHGNLPRCQGAGRGVCGTIDVRDERQLSEYGRCLVNEYPTTRDIPLTKNAFNGPDLMMTSSSTKSVNKYKKKRKNVLVDGYQFETDKECTEFVHLFFRDCRQLIPSCSVVRSSSEAALPVLGCLFSRYPELMIPLMRLKETQN